MSVNNTRSSNGKRARWLNISCKRIEYKLIILRFENNRVLESFIVISRHITRGRAPSNGVIQGDFRCTRCHVLRKGKQILLMANLPLRLGVSLNEYYTLVTFKF